MREEMPPPPFGLDRGRKESRSSMSSDEISIRFRLNFPQAKPQRTKELKHDHRFNIQCESLFVKSLADWSPDIYCPSQSHNNGLQLSIAKEALHPDRMKRFLN
jgi:hypothetical protein